MTPMRNVLFVLLVACKGPDESDTGPVIPADCEVTDPGGNTCSVPAECRVICLCSNDSRVAMERCEGQCPTNASQCELGCQAVGWSGVACEAP